MKCDFCGKEIPFGTGLMYAKKDGKVLYFCSSKCMKNAVKLKRDPKLTRWSKMHEPNAKKKKSKKKRKK